MKLWVLVWIALFGCGRLDVSPVAVCSASDCPDGGPPPPGCLSFSTEIDTCRLAAGGDLTLPGASTYDTDAHVLLVAGTPMPVVRTAVAIDGVTLDAIVVHDLALMQQASLRVTGSAPLAIVATGKVTLDEGAIIDVSAGGAGAQTQCAAPAGRGQDDVNGAGGGGGGGFAAIGGRGGRGNKRMGSPSAGGPPSPSVSIPKAPVGGCPGAPGGTGAAPGGAGGLGGGALYLVAAGGLAIEGAGAIYAGGGGGRGGSFAAGAGNAGGGGGGSGGMIWIEAPSVTGSPSTISANGGGGGEGAGAAAAGRDGDSGPVPAGAPAGGGGGAGGAADGADGGRGGSNASPAGQDVVEQENGGGGGGGGAVGFVVFTATNVPSN